MEGPFGIGGREWMGGGGRVYEWVDGGQESGGLGHKRCVNGDREVVNKKVQ